MTLSTVPTLLLLAVVLTVFYRFCRVSSPPGTVGSQGEGTGGTSTPGACRPESGE